MNKYKASELDGSGDPPSFDDVLLVPSYTKIRSRLDPVTTSYIGGGLSLDTPIISSPMDTVTGSSMAISMSKNGAMGIIHRFMPPREQVLELRKVVNHNDSSDGRLLSSVVPAIGVGDSERDRFSILYEEYGQDLLTAVAIDVANGHSEYMKDMIDWVQNKTGGLLPIIAGNVATGEGFAFLAEAGANAVRVGIGGGSICKTRIMTGVGVPTFASVLDCQRVRTSNSLYSGVGIIADGGVRYPADLAKSIAAGADAVMAGRIFAGTLESPGDTLNIDGKAMKIYRGMASKEVQDDKRGGLRPGTCAEGVSTYIPVKGKAYYILEEFAAGMRSAMTYLNAIDINSFRNNARFIRLTSSALEESHAFGTKV